MPWKWILGIVIALALFAIVVGGLLWPRPQFRKGPWAVPDSTVQTAPAPMDSVAEP